jgi:hypothetical protein
MDGSYHFVSRLEQHVQVCASHWTCGHRYRRAQYLVHQGALYVLRVRHLSEEKCDAVDQLKKKGGQGEHLALVHRMLEIIS